MEWIEDQEIDVFTEGQILVEWSVFQGFMIGERGEDWYQEFHLGNQ